MNNIEQTSRSSQEKRLMWAEIERPANIQTGAPADEPFAEAALALAK
jgi:hypothetical protein